jgi:hypothetical protein
VADIEALTAAMPRRIELVVPRAVEVVPEVQVAEVRTVSIAVTNHRSPYDGEVQEQGATYRLWPVVWRRAAAKRNDGPQRL